MSKLKTKEKPSFVTPEYIEKQRSLREKRKLKKLNEKETDNSIDSNLKSDFNLKLNLDSVNNNNFTPRPMIKTGIKECKNDKKIFTIMSYNILAQALVRRDMYPSSGNILRWKVRSKILLDELKYYQPDILSLQEVDEEKFYSFYRSKLIEFGYECFFFKGGDYFVKSHGLLIAWKWRIFEKLDSSSLIYDLQDCKKHNLPKSAYKNTKNIAIAVALKFRSKDVSHKDQVDKSDKYDGIIVGNTHIFWHPMAMYERSRQVAFYLNWIETFSEKMKNNYVKIDTNSNNNTENIKINDDNTHIHVSSNESEHTCTCPISSFAVNPASEEKPQLKLKTFLTGDFNTEPYHVPYLLATRQPLSDFAIRVLIRSILHKNFSKEIAYYSKENNVNDSNDSKPKAEKNEDENEDEETESNSIVLEYKKNGWPVTEEEREKARPFIDKLVHYYDNLSFEAKSLYGLEYSKIDPKNSIQVDSIGRNWSGEPAFSNWTDGFVGLLDYIFILSPKNSKEIDVDVLELLRLPREEEMGKKPNGLPRNGFPSDHLSLMAKVALN